MNAQKWIHPTTGEVRVYINGFKGDTGSIKAFASADNDGNAVVTVTCNEYVSQKQIENAKADIRQHFGLYVKFEKYLAACKESSTRTASHAYGSAYANAFERATGESFGE